MGRCALCGHAFHLNAPQTAAEAIRRMEEQGEIELERRAREYDPPSEGET